MADGVEGGAGFWLPVEFFDDFATDKENLDKNTKTTDAAPDLCFPTEFPYELETQAAAGHFGKRWVMSTSPQSTLARGGSWSAGSNGSPNGVYSPPASPLGAEFDAVGDLIHRAAGQVAKLKLSGANGVGHSKHAGFLVAPRNVAQLHPLPKNSNQTALQNIHLQQNYLMMKQQKPGCRVWYGEPQMHQIRATGRAMAGRVLGEEAWPIRPNPARISTSIVLGGSGGAAATKRGRTGTGVFLPRQYGFSSDSRRNTGSVCAPDRNANAHVLNKNLSNVNGFMQYQPQPHPKSKGSGFLSNYDLLIAQKNALMLQHRQSLLHEHSSSPGRGGVCLPQEWAY